MLFRTEHLAVVPAEQDLIEQINTANSKYPDNIDYSDVLSRVSSTHPELTTEDLEKILAFTRSQITAENEVFAVVLRENGKTIGYFQVLNQSSKTPSIGIGLLHDY